MSVPDVLPPSPPTTNHRNRTSLPVPYKPIMSTPDDSPASFPPSSSAGNRKRVEFSPWPNVADPSTTTPVSEATALKALPPSRDCQTSSKSILKPYSDPVISITTSDGASEAYSATTETLESLALQLATNNKGSSLDAYQILAQIVKAYDEIPEDVNTRSHIATVLRCIKRDLSMNDQTQSSPIDTNLMTQALKVAVVLVWSEHLSPLLTDEFRVFIIDRSINALSEHTAPKVIIIHYMHLLAMQNFRPGILSANNRAVKLLEALQEITSHVQGKGAMSERLLIYQKLIDQAKQIMKNRASLWLKEVFMGLASSVKDIRDKAVSVSTKACVAFPASPTIANAAREALATIVPDKTGQNRTVSFILTQRLEKMIAAKDEAIQVPPIWSLGMLLCNSIDVRLDSWNLLRDWLKVIQRCFNCSDTSVRSQAFPAWNRFIYISKPHEASDAIVAMLAKPIIAQIERTSTNISGKGLRPAAVSSYCMLLYYAFRPAASHKQYTRIWNEYIVKIMGTQFLSRSTANADLCSRIIMSLMGKEPYVSRIWNENRAHENTLLEPEDLPVIDCRWIRSKAEAILQIFGLLFKHSVWGPSVQHSDQAYVAKAWRYFLKAIRESASKEIKPSIDTRKALSNIIQFIQEVAETQSSASAIDAMDARSRLACSIAIAELGPVCFIESLELDPVSRPPVMIEELIKVALTSLTAVHSSQLPPKHYSSAHNLPHNMQRCLMILDEVLQESYSNHDSNSALLPSVMHIAMKVLRLVPPQNVVSCLSILEKGLSIVLYDEQNFVQHTTEPSRFYKQWANLSRAIVDRVVELSASQYQQLDDLIAAILSSNNFSVRNLLLEAWNQVTWQGSGVTYGPKLLVAIEEIQRHVDVNLPGIHVISRGPQTQIQREVQLDSQAKKATSISKTAQFTADTTGGDHQAASPKAATKSHQQVLAQQKIDEVQPRSRHNDTQLNFVPIDSSPQDIMEMESQYLTARQREVRDRQRAQQAVTFADLRSSPKSRAVHSSRAASVDCEIARKVAAMSGLPSTPPINKQLDPMDEDDLPTPTPKARHKILNLPDVEIPSSPPSIATKRMSNVGNQDVPSSPPKAQTENEIDMVTLDDADLVRDDSAVMAYETVKQLNHGQGETAIPMDVVKENVESTMNPTDTVSEPGSTVLETVQEVDQQKRTASAVSQPDIDQDQNNTSDETDDLSASQLSQSLSWHIAEEAKDSESTSLPQAVQPQQKRKKRATSGYADQDRKKRRRRGTSRMDTSMSSIASDESHATSEDLEAESCIVVSTSPTAAHSRHSSFSDKATDDEHTSTTPAGKRRQIRRQRTNHIPLHVKTRSSQSAQNSNSNPSSAVARVASASTEILDESIYESLITKSLSGNIAQSPGTVDRILIQVPPPREAGHLVHVGTSVESAGSQSPETDIMNALQTALEKLKSIKNDQQANIDLRAIDDLCFKIRYQAQDIASYRTMQQEQ